MNNVHGKVQPKPKVKFFFFPKKVKKKNSSLPNSHIILITNSLNEQYKGFLVVQMVFFELGTSMKYAETIPGIVFSHVLSSHIYELTTAVSHARVGRNTNIFSE